MADVLLTARERYALPILQPLSEALVEAGHAVSAWFDGPLAASGARMPGPVAMLDLRSAVALRPWAVFCASNSVPLFLGGAKVQLFHGFNAEKRPDERGHFRVRGMFDLYCTQGPSTTVEFRRLAAQHRDFAVVETGWPKLDPLFRDDGGAAEALRAQAGGRRVVMFASTFTERLSAAPHLFDAIAGEVARGEFYWLLTLHPKTGEGLRARYAGLAGANAQFVEPEVLVTAQRAAEVLLADTTSVVQEFIVRHKPVVTFRHRAPKPYMLDFDQPGRLREMLGRALAPEPDLLREIRRHADAIHPWRDGRSSQRVIAATEDLIAGRLGPLRPKSLAGRLRGLQERARLRYWGPGA